MVEIQRAGVKDHGMVTELLVEFENAVGNEPHADRDRWERVVAELLDSDRWLFLLALEDSEPVGLAVVNWFLTLFASSADARLVAVVVEPERRGAGVGTALMKEALSAARRRGCRVLEVSAENSDGAIEFFRRFEPGTERVLLVWAYGG